MNKKFSGVIFSYLLIVVDVLVALFFVPFLLEKLGDHEYGLYKLLLSTASYLSILDFGLGGTITRYIVKYKTEGDQKKQENFMAMGLVIYAVLAMAVIALGVAMCVLIPVAYKKSIPAEQMGQAQLIYLLMTISHAINLFSHAFTGLFSAHERFVYNQGSSIMRIVCRVLMITIGFRWIRSAEFVTVVDLVLAVGLLACHILYCKFGVRCRVKLHKWDGKLAKETLVFASAIFLQAIITQFNTNVDNMVLGAFCSTAVVTMYSLVLQIHTMYSGLSTAICTVYLPAISTAVFQGATDEQITHKLVAPGRIQLCILLMVITGFCLLGQEFITIWVGSSYEQVYVLVLILMIASVFDLSQNTVNSVLKAKNMLHGKSLIMGVSTLGNFVITLILVPKIGTFGAAIGTVASMVFGYGLASNIYYHKKIHINMFIYYKEAYKGILPAALLSALLGYGICWVIPMGGWSGFLLKGCCYVAVYCTILYFIGLNSVEKNLLKKGIHKIFKR